MPVSQFAGSAPATRVIASALSPTLSSARWAFGLSSPPSIPRNRELQRPLGGGVFRSPTSGFTRPIPSWGRQYSRGAPDSRFSHRTTAATIMIGMPATSGRDDRSLQIRRIPMLLAAVSVTPGLGGGWRRRRGARGLAAPETVSKQNMNEVILKPARWWRSHPRRRVCANSHIRCHGDAGIYRKATAKARRPSPAGTRHVVP
jgi:hypothetical protein